MELTESTLLQRNEECLVSTQLDGELVMMNIETGEYLGLEKSGLAIWNLLEVQISLGELISKIKQTYKVSGDEYQKQTTSFVESLINEGLIKLS